MSLGLRKEKSEMQGSGEYFYLMVLKSSWVSQTRTFTLSDGSRAGMRQSNPVDPALLHKPRSLTFVFVFVCLNDYPCAYTTMGLAPFRRDSAGKLKIHHVLHPVKRVYCRAVILG